MTTAADAASAKLWPFRGVCLGVPAPQDWDVCRQLITDVLPAHGCNALVLLIRYQYAFPHHPAVADAPALTRAQAAEIAGWCRAAGLRLIPKMNLLGHQSGKTRETNLGLLRAHPELDETPDRAEVRYCRSLCPRHPDAARLVGELADDLLDAFGADALHVGLDEVFEIGYCPRCRGTPTATLFADWVNALHAHLVGRRGVELFMWADRLLDGDKLNHEWEASRNMTWPAIDLVPRDIVMCDWHYGESAAYPSVRTFIDRGFRTIICPWKDAPATAAFLRFAQATRNEWLLGVMQTTWCNPGPLARYLVCGDTGPLQTPRLVGESFKLAFPRAAK